MPESKQPDSAAERRAHYRLHYPLQDRPLLHLGERRFAVTEISEGGLRVRNEQTPPLSAGQDISGVLEFAAGESDTVEGRVARLVGDEAVLALGRGISFRRMVAEQIRLHHKYSNLFDHPATGD